MAPAARTLTCVACGLLEAPLCRRCAGALIPGPRRRLGGRPAAAAFAHRGTGRRLAHLLKYGGHAAVARLAAGTIAARLPAGAGALVPVPRARVRLARYGVDPARLLAIEVARVTGLSVIPALRAGVWWPRHADRGRSRHSPSLTRRAPGRDLVLVDDVMTTGSTLLAAFAVLGPSAVGAVTLTGVE